MIRSEGMRIVDLHCDVLLKMWRDESIDFYDDSKLQVNYKQLQKIGSLVQVMAIYVPQNIPMSERFLASLQMIEIFKERILAVNDMLQWIQTANDVKKITDGKIGVLLSLEGVEPIGDQLTYLKTLYQLGVKGVGITWNYANLAGDGVLEPRGGGLTSFGKDIVALNDIHRVITDVSHLSQNGIYDCLSLTTRCIASHSNVYDVCPHPRNIKKEAIEWMIQAKGLLGITFVPPFVDEHKPNLEKLLQHIEFVLALGGEDIISFGSDFDGMDDSMSQLNQIGDYDRLLQFLSRYYPDETLRKMSYKNAYQFFSRKL